MASFDPKRTHGTSEPSFVVAGLGQCWHAKNVSVLRHLSARSAVSGFSSR